MAEFVFNELGLTTAAAIHDGDPYTQGLAQAFADAFEGLGGTVTGFTGVSKEDTDMVPVLTEVAADAPEALFFPIFQPAGDFIADQAPGVAGMENTQLLAADGLLTDGFMELPQSEGIFFSVRTCASVPTPTSRPARPPRKSSPTTRPPTVSPVGRLLGSQLRRCGDAARPSTLPPTWTAMVT